MEARRGKKGKRRGEATGLLLLPLAVLGFACGGNESILRSGKETPTKVATETSTFAADLESMRTANFIYIFALRRRDGAAIDADDRAVIKLQTGGANRRVAADDGRAFLIGSNLLLPAQNMAALNERFAVDDHSPPPPADTNANPNK